MSSLVSEFKKGFELAKSELANMPEETFELLLQKDEYLGVADALRAIRLSKRPKKKKKYVKMPPLKPTGFDDRNFSWKFVDLMRNRIIVSSHKYGDLEKFKKDIRFYRDELKNVKYRIGLYEKTGNTEYLIDAANFLMFEFMEMHGQFKATDDDKHSIVLGEV